MKITILVDNKNSFIMPYAEDLRGTLNKRGHSCQLLNHADEIKSGDICILLGCEKKLDSKILKLNKHNLVVHESALPKGRGWSPLTWQILGGKKDIPVSLIEAADEIDSGVIYFQEKLHFNGDELNSELKDAQGKISIKLLLKFIDKYPNVRGKKQIGKATYYKKRTPKDSELDINMPLKKLLPLLRVCDNERYPAFFMKNGKKFIIKIEKS